MAYRDDPIDECVARIEARLDALTSAPPTWKVRDKNDGRQG